MNSHQPVNPYIAGSPVTGTEMFYGRQDVFSFVRRNLVGRHRDSSIVLYGQRRTGKTSVLYQMHHHLDDGYWCVFVDLHGLNLSGLGNLMLGIAVAISRDLRRDHGISLEVPDRGSFEADPRQAFETRFLDQVWSALGDKHLVLMLDEAIRLEEEVQAGRLGRDVFDYLRHLMQHHVRLNFIFSLGSGVEEMAKQYALLFSVSLYRRISFLEPEAAHDLVTQPARDQYEVTPEGVARILSITSGHPYYTQLLCHCLFDSWARDPRPMLNEADVERALPEAIELGSANLTYVWEDSTAAEQAVMAGMAAVMRVRGGPVTADQVLDIWREAGVSIPEGEVMRAVRSLVSREVLTYSQAFQFAVDLQRLWLDKHRRIDWVKDGLAEALREGDHSGEPRGEAGQDPPGQDPPGQDSPGPRPAVGEIYVGAGVVRKSRLLSPLASVTVVLLLLLLLITGLFTPVGAYIASLLAKPSPSDSTPAIVFSPITTSSQGATPSGTVSVGAGVSATSLRFDIPVSPSAVSDEATRTQAVTQLVNDLNQQLSARHLQGKKAAIVEVFASGPASGIAQAVHAANVAFDRMKMIDPFFSEATGQSFWLGTGNRFEFVIYFFK